MGPGALDFAQGSLSQLGTYHTFSGMQAESSFANIGDLSDEHGQSPVCAAGQLTAGAAAIGESAGRMLDRPSGDWVCVYNYSGESVLVDNRISTSAERIPSGLFHTMLRPFPWETKSKLSLLAAGLESPMWIVIYGLAGVGVWTQRHRFRQLVFPVLITLAVSVSGAMSHGNLGTAFRHRGQILFSLVLLAVCGIQGLVDRRGDKQADRTDRP